MDYSEFVFGKENRTYLMGISMIWIVLFHVYLWSTISGITIPRWLCIFDKGALGVDVFLLLSAYGLQASIERNNIRNFYLNRIKRLFPVYFFFLLTLFSTFERDCSFNKMLIQCVYQITGLSLFKYSDFFSCGFCFDWFTPAIVIIYIFFPLLSKIVYWINKKGILYEILMMVLCVIIGTWIRENKHFSFGLLAIRFPVLYLGMIAFVYLNSNKIHKLLVLVIIAACLGLLSGNDEMRLSLLLPPLLITFAMASSTQPAKRFFCLVGRYSYEVYLAHIFPVAFLIPLTMTDNILIILLLTCVLTIFVTYVYCSIQKIFYSALRVFVVRFSSL